MQTLLGACVSTQTHHSKHQATTQAPERLVDYSPGDRPWDVHRAQADAVAAIYAGAQEFERYAQRIGTQCSGVLRFGWQTDPDTGESRLRLREAHFCRVRHCPVCQWRRSLMWQARFYEAIPAIVAAHPTARWLFLTLTVRNCQIHELGAVLTAMNAGWRRLIKRDDLCPVLGWIRTTEVTRGKDNSAHPHFHVLLMVRPSMLATHYIPHVRWVQLWRQCMRLDYDPVVDIRTVKPRKKDEPLGIIDALRGAIAETLKYSTKPADMLSNDAWFLELTRQVHRRRFIATGGVLKNILREDEESDEDLALADGEGGDDGKRIGFRWRADDKHYCRARKFDVE